MCIRRPAAVAAIFSYPAHDIGLFSFNFCVWEEKRTEPALRDENEIGCISKLLQKQFVYFEMPITYTFMDNFKALHISLKIRLQKKGQKCRNHCKKIAFETWAIIPKFMLGAIVARKLKSFETRWSFFSCPSVQKIIGRQLNSTVWTELCFAPLWNFFRGRYKATNKKLFEVHRNHHDVQAKFFNRFSLNNNTRIVSQTIEPFSIMLP